jgi:hypothetical protein
VRFSNVIPVANQVAIHYIIECFTLIFSIPFEIFVSGIVNEIAPAIENVDFEVVDKRMIIFGKVEIIVVAVTTGGGDGVGEVDDQVAGIIFRR